MATAATATRQIASQRTAVSGKIRNAGRKRTREELAEEMDPATLIPRTTMMDKGILDIYTTAETGRGTYDDPHSLPLRDGPNDSGCIFCPTATCSCRLFSSLLETTFDQLERKIILERAGKKHLCAKSILPCFVSRIAAILDVGASDVFYDLGSGNGSVLFQMAFITGAKCVGVELCPHNAQLARDAWAAMKPELEQLAGRPMPEVTIVTGDLCDYLVGKVEDERGNVFQPASNTKIWTSSKLMPQSVLNFMGTYFLTDAFPVGAQVASLADLYPHGRSVARALHPDWFDRMEMTDYNWALGSVEWTCMYIEKFHRFVKSNLARDDEDEEAE